MHKLIIGAPYGNYLTFSGATSVLGSFTQNHRGGIWYRIWRFIRTVRYYRRPQSWINKLGLPTPSIKSLVEREEKKKTELTRNNIVSIYGFNRNEWCYLASMTQFLSSRIIEMNLSCPNVNHTQAIADIDSAIKIMQGYNKSIIVKLPPIQWMKFGKPLFDLGIRYFHLCNTIPTPGGGFSGKVLKQYSLWAIDDFRNTFGEQVILIGGGGITSNQDIVDYIDTGADYVSTASFLNNPFNWPKIKDMVITANSYPRTRRWD
jgi:dihydroorotate dehydrogenase